MQKNANDTYFGGIITSRHYLIIAMKTACCVDNPRIEIPIKSGTSSMTTGFSTTPSPGSVPEPENEAVALPAGFSNGATVVSPVFVPGTAALVGGVMVESEENEPEFSFSLPSDPKPPSLATLKQEMTDSVSDLDIVEKKLEDPTWKAVFVNLKPTDYADLIRKVRCRMNHEVVSLYRVGVPVGSEFEVFPFPGACV